MMGGRSRFGGAGWGRRRSGSFVSLPDGTRLRYVERGDPQGEPLILLHGYSDSWFSFSRVLPLLDAGRRVIALDQRGHGRSDRPASGYGMGDLAGDVLAFMDAVGIDRAVVVGHSMGSLVAQQVAAEAPGRVEALVLLGAGYGPSGVPAVVELVQVVGELPDPIPTEFIREFQAGTVYAEVPAEFMATVVSESARLPAPVWRSLIRGIVEMDPVAETVARNRTRTLIVWGDRDAVFPAEEQAALRAALPEATFLAMEETGHAPHWERPARFAEALARFVGPA